MKLKTRIILVLALVAASGAAVFMYYVLRSADEGSPQFRKLAREYTEKMGRGPGRLKPGEPAPDFELKRLNSDDRVRLSSFANKKPVALVFGSYT